MFVAPELQPRERKRIDLIGRDGGGPCPFDLLAIDNRPGLPPEVRLHEDALSAQMCTPGSVKKRRHDRGGDEKAERCGSQAGRDGTEGAFRRHNRKDALDISGPLALQAASVRSRKRYNQLAECTV
jgi:hypothetical protein